MSLVVLLVVDWRPWVAGLAIRLMPFTNGVATWIQMNEHDCQHTDQFNIIVYSCSSICSPCILICNLVMSVMQNYKLYTSKDSIILPLLLLKKLQIIDMVTTIAPNDICLQYAGSHYKEVPLLLVLSLTRWVWFNHRQHSMCQFTGWGLFFLWSTISHIAPTHN